MAVSVSGGKISTLAVTVRGCGNPEQKKRISNLHVSNA
jgi:hypothetical protein